MQNQTNTAIEQPNAMAKIIKFLAFYGVKTKTLKLRTMPNGQVEKCSGDLQESMTTRHRKLIQREYDINLPKKDFRFHNTKLILEDKEFLIVRHD
jgi:hypothetical protein